MGFTVVASLGKRVTRSLRQSGSPMQAEDRKAGEKGLFTLVFADRWASLQSRTLPPPSASFELRQIIFPKSLDFL